MKLIYLFALSACQLNDPKDAEGLDVDTSTPATVTSTGTTGTTATTGTTTTTGTTATTGTTGTTGTSTTTDVTTPPTLWCDPAPPRVLINEVVASNRDSLFDETGETPDWIELYNADLETVDLTGWGLSDDEDDLFAYRFGAATLGPGERFLLLASGEGRESLMGSWDTRIDQGHLWSYLPVFSEPDPDWASPDFDDSSWDVGPSGFGRSDYDDATITDAHTIYVRTGFDVTEDELEDLAEIWLHVDYDDGFVAWLNGVEIARAGVSGYPPAWDAYADAPDHEAVVYQGLVPEGWDITDHKDLFVSGRNVLAVEVHDVGSTSSDLSLIPFLTFGFSSFRPGTASPLLGLDASSLHTSFKLSAKGEDLWLTAPDGCTADRLEVPRLWRDEAYGRSPDGGDLGFFMESTPGEANTTESRPGFAETPELSLDPGYHTFGTRIGASSPSPDAVLYMTRDGAPPTDESLAWTDRYVGNEAEIVRVRAYEEGLWPSRIATGTYLYRPRADVGVVSLVMDPHDLWDPEEGIYVGENYWEDWERDVHAEIFEPDGKGWTGFNSGIVIHGGASRGNAQRSFRLAFRAGYGESDLDYDLFEGHDIDEFERLILRNGGNDWHGCGDWCSDGAFMRDLVAHRIIRNMDVDSLRDRAVLVYLNGEHWGMYNLRERADKFMIGIKYGEEDVDVLEWEGWAVEGDNLHWLETMDYLRVADREDPETYAWLGERVEIPSYIDYQIGQIYIDNWDWPGNNLKWWRPRTEDGRWRWLLYDTDFGLGIWGGAAWSDTLAFALDPWGPSWPNPPWSTEFFRLCMDMPEFQHAFANRYADLLNTEFLPTRTTAILEEAREERDLAMVEQLVRWGSDPWGYDIWEGAWDDELDGIHDWLVDRPDYARDHVMNNLDLDGTYPLDLWAEPFGAGSFTVSTVDVEPPFFGTYFQGLPFEVTAVPKPGFTFVGWDDPSLGTDPTITVEEDDWDGLTLVAVFE